jgi:hypothetical protein
LRLSTTTLVAFIGFGVLGTAIAAGGCSSDSGGTTSGNNNTGSGGANGGTGAGAGAGTGTGTGFGGGLSPDGGADDGSLNEDTACEATKVQANYEQRPADIIFVIDNSGSMTDEILSVQRNINENFASIIEASGIDYRVIMVSRHGSAELSQEICVEAPLGSGSCTPVPTTPNTNPPKFFQYDVEVHSNDSLCLILDTLRGAIPARGNTAPATGWSTWLRPESLKVFVEFTDDNVNCTTTSLGAGNVTMNDDVGETVDEGLVVAATFDAALTGTAPEYFGTASERNYTFFSFIGIRANDPPTAPWPPDAPLLGGFAGQCEPEADGPGTGYQKLSAMTGGLRYPICEYETYDAVFQAVADSVISGAKLSCSFDVPEAPPGQTIDLATVQVEFTPSNGGSKLTFSQVPNAQACMANSFYIEDRKIILCDDTCTVARSDNAAAVNIFYGCNVRPN